MDSFNFYLKIGFEHIADMAAYDHILFLVVLCAVYRIEQWRKILILVTAFTIGHSVTLVLVSMDVFSIPSKVVKFLIPLTIFLTALHNAIGSDKVLKTIKMKRNYVMALFFGLIHGMDFSNYFKALIMDPSDMLVPLLGFNIGIELGQLLIVFVIVGIAFLFLNVFKVKHREWNLFISGAAAGISLLSLFKSISW